MMKSIYSFLIICVLFGSVFAQQKPEFYDFNGFQKINKISDSTPRSNSINDILIIGDTIWLGTSRGLSRSFDNGVSWTNYYETQDFGTEGITAIGYRDGIIWTGTGHVDDGVQVGSGLQYSTDKGETWNAISQSVDDPGDSSIVYGINNIRALPITVPQQNINFDLALTKNTIWVTSWAGGLRKSTDNGSTWQRVVLPPDNLNSIKPTDTLSFSLQVRSGNFGPENHLNHVAFSVIATNDSTLFVGTAAGINKSTDGGISWTRSSVTNQTNHITGNFVTALKHNVNDNSVWAATWVAEGGGVTGVSATWDNAENWTTFLIGEKARNFGIVNPGGSNFDGVICSADNGAFRTTDQGDSWIVANQINDSNTKTRLSSSTFYSANSKNVNGTTEIWLGSNNGLVKLEESNQFWDGNWKVFIASPDLTTVDETYAFPNPFSPDDEEVKIKYQLSSQGKVTIRIFDFDMNLVKTIIQNAPRSGNSEIIDYWNGRNENGLFVANGIYFYRIDIDGADPIYNKIIVLR